MPGTDAITRPQQAGGYPPMGFDQTTAVSLPGGPDPFVRSASSTSDVDQSDNRQVAIQMNTQRFIPGLLSSRVLGRYGPDRPFQFVPYLLHQYERQGFKPEQDRAWSNFFQSRSKWLYEKGYDFKELHDTRKFMQSEDIRTDRNIGVLGATAFAGAGIIIGSGPGAALVAKYGPLWGRFIAGAGVGLLEAAGSKILSPHLMDWRYSTVPHPEKMLDPAVFEQYDCLTPSNWKIIKAAIDSFGFGYTLSNLAKIPVFAATAALQLNPVANVVADGALGMSIGGTYAGQKMGGTTRDNAFITTMARDDFENQMRYVRERMQDGATRSLSTDLALAAQHSTELATSAFASVLPPVLAQHVVGEQFGPPDDASWVSGQSAHLDDRRDGVQLAGRQLCGSSSSMRLFNWVGSLVRTSLR